MSHASVDYTTQDGRNQMPAPYVQFVTRTREGRAPDGSATFTDVVWVKVTASGTKDTLEKVASEWLTGMKANADNGRIPAHWPDLYQKAIAAFEAGETLPLNGAPIKSWSALSPAQRSAVLNANILTVEDLAVAHDEAKSRIGMGAQALVTMAQAWVAEAKGPGALARKVQDLAVQVEALLQREKELVAENKQLGESAPKATK